MNEEPAIIITKHAALRGLQRLRLNHGSLLRAAQAAMRQGMPMAETGGELWHWLEAGMLRHKGGNMTRIHAGAVFIIHDHRLLTVYLLPKEHRSQVARWLARNPLNAKSSGSLKDPRSGAVTPDPARSGLKKSLEALKSPVVGDSQPGGAA